jgi:trk system potassium uptake protein TrkH
MILMGAGYGASSHVTPEAHIAPPVQPTPHGGLSVNVGGALQLTGGLLAPLGLVFLFPAAIAVGYGEPAWPFLVSGLATSAAGLSIERLTSGRERVGVREGFLVVALIWTLVALFGALPYLLAEPQLSNPVDALFESMSGFSTTGASVLTDIEAIPRSMAMWRQLTAWVGGLGIIVLFLAVLPRLNVAGRQALFRTEMPGPELGLEETIRETARRFVTLYVAITGVEILVLATLGWTGIDERMTLFNAVAHSFATVATAGFSPEARSLEPFAATTQWVIVLFMVTAGTNFALLYAGLVLRRPRALARDEEFRVYLVLLAIASLIVLMELANAGIFSGEGAVRQAVFNTVSMMTTTGFASADFNEWTSLTALTLFGVTLLSASAGSTSGSIKLVRHVVIAKMLRREIHHAVHPELIAPLRLNGAVVDERTLRAIIVFVFIYLGVCAAGAVTILIDSSLRGVDLTAFQSLAVSTSLLGGVGPGLGFAGPMGSYDPFSDLSKLVLTAEMYLGRLEIVPVLVLFARAYWRG